MTIPFAEFRAGLLADPAVKAEYDRIAPMMDIAFELAAARARSGLSQAELAARMGTSKAVISRMENGSSLPSIRTLLRFAEATGSKVQVRLPAA